MVKCPHCDEQFDRESVAFEKVGRRYYHEDCFVEYQKAKAIEDKAKEKKKEVGNELEGQRRALIAYVMELQNTNRPNGLVFKQIKDLYEQGFSYIGMKSTLYYFHEIMGNPVLGTGIGIVPFVYEDAIQWYTKKSVAGRHFDDLVKGGLENATTKRVVRTSTKKLEARVRNKIDISEL